MNLQINLPNWKYCLGCKFLKYGVKGKFPKSKFSFTCLKYGIDLNGKPAICNIPRPKKCIKENGM